MSICFNLNRILLPKFTYLSIDGLNLITFGMTAVSLVGAVIQLAMISNDNADAIYRSYLGKLSCCHFSLVRIFDIVPVLDANKVNTQFNS